MSEIVLLLEDQSSEVFALADQRLAEEEENRESDSKKKLEKLRLVSIRSRYFYELT